MRSVPFALCGLLLTACASKEPAVPRAARSTDDPRVQSFEGKPPPDLAIDAMWLNAPATSSLAAMRGRVVYLQFAFPT